MELIGSASSLNINKKVSVLLKLIFIPVTQKESFDIRA